MPYLVDGDNLLGTWPDRRRSDAERRRLSFQLARLAQSERRRVVVVFDGASPPAANIGPDVHFAGPREADAVMLELLGREPDRRGWIVVTSDRALGDQCRWLGARIVRCDRFRGRLIENEPGEKPGREADVAGWLERFGEDPEREPDPGAG